jgi:hypothetical protein
MRLIDADELKTAFPACDNSKAVLVASVRATINHMPTIQSEIIRCEDCMFYKADDDIFHDRQDWCEMWESGTVAYGYCYHADRREHVEEA